MTDLKQTNPARPGIEPHNKERRLYTAEIRPLNGKMSLYTA
jgi:hypothetical protein